MTDLFCAGMAEVMWRGCRASALHPRLWALWLRWGYSGLSQRMSPRVMAKSVEPGKGRLPASP